MIQDESMHMDILACQLANTEDGVNIIKELQLLTEVCIPVYLLYFCIDYEVLM